MLINEVSREENNMCLTAIGSHMQWHMWWHTQTYAVAYRDICRKQLIWSQVLNIFIGNYLKIEKPHISFSQDVFVELYRVIYTGI